MSEEGNRPHEGAKEESLAGKAAPPLSEGTFLETRSLRQATAIQIQDPFPNIPKFLLGELQDFQEAVASSNAYIDKTLLITEILKESTPKYIYITRPRGWGKSLNLSMLYYFFNIRYTQLTGQVEAVPNYSDLFSDLKIAACFNDNAIKKELGQYIVLKLSLGSVEYDNLEGDMRKLLHRIVDEHCYLLGSGELRPGQKRKIAAIYNETADLTDMEFFLHHMTHALSTHFKGKKVVVLIDEFDRPLMCALTVYLVGKISHDDSIIVRDFLNGFIWIISKEEGRTKCVNRIILTGITDTVQSSRMNNFIICSIVDFGFNEEEVVLWLKWSKNLLLNWKP